MRNRTTIRGSDTDHPRPHEVLAGGVRPIEVLRRCGRTFYVASRMLPRSVRHDLALLYAFCRVVDDTGDLPGSESGAADAALDRITSDLRGDSSRAPLIADFVRLAERHGVPLVLAHQLIEGVRSDLRPVRMRTQAELLRYAYRVASTVGLMMCRVLRVPPAGDPFAVDLGIAMQLTNIARDVREDAEADRYYLPESWIDHSVVAGAIGPGDRRSVAEATDCVERLLGLADRYYESADGGMRYLPLAVRPGIRAAASSYRAIGEVIRRDPERALTGRARTSAIAKLSRSITATGSALLDEVSPGGRSIHDATLHTAVAPLLAPAASA
jgi:phytoene synthase